MQPLHNCHTHLFTNRAVPNGLMPLGLMHVARTRVGAAVLGFILQTLWPFSRNDPLDRLASFMTIGQMESQAAIFDHVRKFYPSSTRFVVLSLDMDYMGAGQAPQPFEAQLEELSALRQQVGDRLIPFVCADPRRPNVLELVRTYIEKHNFGGIKLYPPLGFYPFDRRLRGVYRYAEQNQIPIIAHCSRGGLHFRGPISRAMLAHPKTGAHIPTGAARTFAHTYTHPDNYKYVLADFPQLRLCLSHFGGGREWQAYLRDPWPDATIAPSWMSIITDLIRAYPNVYTDISFTAFDRRLWSLLKVLMNTDVVKERILYGSDYYMVRTAVSEREFSINLRATVGETEYRRMAHDNAVAFLQRGT